jgi:hypothetical protein
MKGLLFTATLLQPDFNGSYQFVQLFSRFFLHVRQDVRVCIQCQTDL